MRSSPRPLLLSRRWRGIDATPRPARQGDGACHRGSKTGSPGFPSLWHATLSVVSRACKEVLDYRQSPLSPHLLRRLGTEAPLLGARYARLHYYGPLRHPRRPGLSLAGFLFEPYRSACQGFPCSYGTPLHPCRHHYPGEPAHVYRRSLRPYCPGQGLFRCAVAAFLLSQRSRRSHYPFRGLLGVHACYGLGAP